MPVADETARRKRIRTKMRILGSGVGTLLAALGFTLLIGAGINGSPTPAPLEQRAIGGTMLLLLAVILGGCPGYAIAELIRLASMASQRNLDREEREARAATRRLRKVPELERGAEVAHDVAATPTPVLADEGIPCSDGGRIPLERVCEVTAPRILLGVDAALAHGEIRSRAAAGPAVVVKYRQPGAKGPPAVELIPTPSFEAADRLVLEIQRARKALSSRGAAKVVVGQCEKCGRDLRLGGAVRVPPTLTCRCGHVSHVPS
jgi:hypothetical protein